MWFCKARQNLLYAVLQSWLILARPWRFSSLFSSEELINMPKYGKTNYIIIILSSHAYLYKSFGTQNHKKQKIMVTRQKTEWISSHHICMHDQVHPNNRIRASSILGWWPLWGFSLNYSNKKKRNNKSNLPTIPLQVITSNSPLWREATFIDKVRPLAGKLSFILDVQTKVGSGRPSIAQTRSLGLFGFNFRDMSSERVPSCVYVISGIESCGVVTLHKYAWIMFRCNDPTSASVSTIDLIKYVEIASCRRVHRDVKYELWTSKSHPTSRIWFIYCDKVWIQTNYI